MKFRWSQTNRYKIIHRASHDCGDRIDKLKRECVIKFEIGRSYVYFFFFKKKQEFSLLSLYSLCDFIGQ